jgi:hypothetical protein
MSFLGKLFGSEKVIDVGMETIDKAFYTDQEKAGDALTRIGLKERILQAYEPFKLAQRYMMLIVGTPYMIIWVATAITAAWGVNTDSLQALLDGKIGDIFELIAMFYFGGGAVEGAIKAFGSIKK